MRRLAFCVVVAGFSVLVVGAAHATDPASGGFDMTIPMNALKAQMDTNLAQAWPVIGSILGFVFGVMLLIKIIGLLAAK